MKGAVKPPLDPVLKAKVLRLADEVGPTEAARRTNLPLGTVKSLRSREKAAQALTVIPTADGEEGLREAANRIYHFAQKSAKAADRAVTHGKSSDVKNLAEASSKLMHQSSLLLAHAERLEAREVEVTTEQGEIMAQAVEQGLGAVGLKLIRTPLGALIASVLKGNDLDPELAQEAKEYVLQRIGEDLRRQGWKQPQEAPVAPEEVEETQQVTRDSLSRDVLPVDSPARVDEYEIVTDVEVVMDDEDATPKRKKTSADEPWDLATDEIRKQWLAAYGRDEDRARREMRRRVEHDSQRRAADGKSTPVRVPPLDDRTTTGLIAF